MPQPVVSGAVRGWAILLLLFAALEIVFDLLRLPSPALFGALTAGLLYALTARRPLAVPGPGITLAQAVLGAAIGALIDVGTLRSLGSDGLPVLVVSLATLALSVAAGFVLRLHRDVSAATGAFAMVAGGASGIVAIARDLGADDRIVAVVQYLRVLLIIVGMPLITQVIFHPGARPGGSGAGAGPAPAEPGWVTGVLFTGGCMLAGLVLHRWIAIPAGALLLPLLVAVALSLTGVAHHPGVPALIQDAAFTVIGLQVGLRFTRHILRSVATLLPLALATILALIVACAALGVLLARATGRTGLDGYLATTPGGLYAVLATAIGSGADVTFVLAVQIVRLFVMLFSAPLLARWLRRSAERPGEQAVR